MKLYISLSILSAIYTAALTLEKVTDPSILTWNVVIGAMVPLALVLSLVPIVGPVLFQTAAEVLIRSLNPPLALGIYIDFFKILSWVINILFTISLIMYIKQYRRHLARRIIKTLLF